MHRQPEHVIQFLFAELGTSGSVDGSGRLVIKGRFQQSESRTRSSSIGDTKLTQCQTFTRANRKRVASLHCRVRHVQDLQVARHDPHQGQPVVLHDMRVVRINTIRSSHQEWFHGTNSQTCQGSCRSTGLSRSVELGSVAQKWHPQGGLAGFLGFLFGRLSCLDKTLLLSSGDFFLRCVQSTRLNLYTGERSASRHKVYETSHLHRADLQTVFIQTRLHMFNHLKLSSVRTYDLSDSPSEPPFPSISLPALL